mgnify:CR=1 FL=1
MLRLTSEIVDQCRKHRDPRNALKLFNNILTNAWSRLPADVTGKYGLKRETVLYERHVTAFIMEALQVRCGCSAVAALLLHRIACRIAGAVALTATMQLVRVSAPPPPARDPSSKPPPQNPALAVPPPLVADLPLYRMLDTRSLRRD